MIRLFAFALVVLVVLVPLVPSTTSAQRAPGAAPSRGPGWLPRKSDFTAAEFKVTAAELTTVINRLTEIERIVAQVEEMANPVGFEIEPSIGGFVRYESVLSYEFDAMVYSPSKRVAGEGSVCFRAQINGLPTAPQTGYHDERSEILVEDEQGPPLAGATHAWRILSPTLSGYMNMMVTAGKVSPMEPVTRERYLKAVILTDTEHANQTRRATSKSSYQMWMAGAAERKAGRDGIRAALPPAQAAALIKTMEDDERKVTADLKASETAEGVENARLISAYTQSVERARVQLAAMSPAERNAPGWLERRGDFVEKLPAGTTVFAAPMAPSSGRLVATNTDLLKGRTSHIEPRILNVKVSTLLSCHRPAVYQMYKKLDWAALARIVNP